MAESSRGGKSSPLRGQCCSLQFVACPHHTFVPQYFNVVKTQNVSLDAKSTELRKAAEELLRLRTTADKHASEFKLLSTGTSSQKEAGLQAEIDKLMVRMKSLIREFIIDNQILQALLKCSTCKMHMRSTVITKCMHSKSSASFLLFLVR